MVQCVGYFKTTRGSHRRCPRGKKGGLEDILPMMLLDTLPVAQGTSAFVARCRVLRPSAAVLLVRSPVAYHNATRFLGTSTSGIALTDSGLCKRPSVLPLTSFLRTIPLTHGVNRGELSRCRFRPWTCTSSPSCSPAQVGLWNARATAQRLQSVSHSTLLRISHLPVLICSL